MTRLLPLIPLILWLTWNDSAANTTAVATLRPEQWLAILWMMGGLFVLVATMMIWARTLLIRYRHSLDPLPTRWFLTALFIARIAGVAWFGVALYFFGYARLIDSLFGPFDAWNVRLPAMLAAILPTFVTWFGLAWAAYPVDRATREQNLLVEINAGLTPRAPPTLAQSLSTNFRFQVLFVLAPVFAVVALKDLVSIAFHLAGIAQNGKAETIAFIACSLTVFIASPELLIRVLRAQTLAPSPLRSRLEVLAKRLDLRYRDILIWHTSYGIGNAAVMGLVPQFRYILLTDLLIETLDDEQIEAVFAHEAGHVKHRHLLWYVAFWAMFLLSPAGPGNTALAAAVHWTHASPTLISVIIFGVLLGICLSGFILLSRLFERQADVFAARSIQSLHAALDANRTSRPPLSTPVGSIGAESFVSALKRVAEISHRPVPETRRVATLAGRLVDVVLNFTHPSIPDRIYYLREMAMRPELTTRFDRKVMRVMLTLIVVLITLATWAIVEQIRSTA